MAAHGSHRKCTHTHMRTMQHKTIEPKHKLIFLSSKTGHAAELYAEGLMGIYRGPVLTCDARMLLVCRACGAVAGSPYLLKQACIDDVSCDRCGRHIHWETFETDTLRVMARPVYLMVEAHRQPWYRRAGMRLGLCGPRKGWALIGHCVNSVGDKKLRSPKYVTDLLQVVCSKKGQTLCTTTK